MEEKRIWLTEAISEMDRGTLRVGTQHREQFAGAEARTREMRRTANMPTQRASPMATFEAKIVPYRASAGTFFYQIRVS